MGGNDQGRNAASLLSEANSRRDCSQRLAPPESSSSDTSSGHDARCRRERENVADDTQVSPRGESSLSIIRPNEATEEIPPVQVMERTDEPGSPAPYKFPSSVFARKASPNPGEWSTASNESLFSIHMGDTGFDDTNHLDDSGEPVSPDADRFPSKKPTPVVVEARSPQLYNNRESGHSPWEGPDASPSPSSRPSNASGASTKSFTFPILTGDDGGSSKKPELPQSARPQASFEKTQPEMFSPRVEVPQDPKSGQEMQQPKIHVSTGGGGWFSCFRSRRYCCGRNCS
ncbi:hypothetical protein MLD38_025014 [Melastoma candidum]|uniref:Uncharacterized protein n=1 Tax=Melastoma candidum TaxID=119954 RepID=A0ACB9NXJ1_9MYRT|nr:hypothetical protein MLD38_025014 [Melastoma candidum]